MRGKWTASLLVLVVACAQERSSEDELAKTSAAITTPFSWSMAGTLVLANDPLRGSAAQLINDHFSYIGQYAVNGCANNNTPYSCANNGCAYPNNPTVEIPSYTDLYNWMVSYRNAGLYVGLWGVSYNNPEAEAHCMAEVANTMKNSYGVAPTFFVVDAEKSYETNFGYSARFVAEFNNALDPVLRSSMFKAESPECHTAIDFAAWLNNGFTSIQPQAYWSDGGWNPYTCLKWSLDYGVPADKCQVMLDGYQHGSVHPWAAYADDMNTFRSTYGGNGFSIWRTVDSVEWDQWKPLLETRNIATYDGRARRGWRADFNGDGRSDIAVYRPSDRTWWIKDQFSTQFGIAGDVQITGDYDGDGRSDIAVWRSSTAGFYVQNQFSVVFGNPTDIPVPADYNGDGRTDVAVWRPSDGTWWVLNGASAQWGASGDVPIPGDYDGDGRADFAVWRKSTATFYVKDQFSVVYGYTTDIPVPADYDGDGRTDVAVWRPSNGTWYVRNGASAQWGVSGDVPIPGDYNGDGRADFAIWRPSTAAFWVKDQFSVVYGNTTDKPIRQIDKCTNVCQ